jgi:WD40 repeat protein
VKVWDATANPEALTLRGHPPGSRVVTFSPDGTRLASSGADRTVKVWNVAGGQSVSFGGHSHVVIAAAFSPDGRRIASATGQDPRAPAGIEVKVWNAETGAVAWTLCQPDAYNARLAFSPDGQQLAVASQDSKVWDVRPGAGPVTSLSADQHRVRVKVWDVSTGAEVPALEGWRGEVLAVSFGADGALLVATSLGRTVDVREAGSGRAVLGGGVVGAGDGVTAAAFSAGGKYVAVGSGTGAVKVWDLGTGRETLTLPEDRRPVLGLAFSPDGTRLVRGLHAGETVTVWDVREGQKVLSLGVGRAVILDVVFSPDGNRLAGAAQDGTVTVWDGTPRAR